MNGFIRMIGILAIFSLALGTAFANTWHPQIPGQFHVMPHTEGNARYVDGQFIARMGLVPDDMASYHYWVDSNGMGLPLGYGVKFSNLSLYTIVDYWDGTSRSITLPATKDYTMANSKFCLPVGAGMRNISIYAIPGFEVESKNSGIITGIVDIWGSYSISCPISYYDEAGDCWIEPFGNYWGDVYHFENVPANAKAVEIIHGWEPETEVPIHRCVNISAD